MVNSLKSNVKYDKDLDKAMFSSTASRVNGLSSRAALDEPKLLITDMRKEREREREMRENQIR